MSKFLDGNQIELKVAMNESSTEKERFEVYNSYVDNITPKFSMIKNIFHAFVVGGTICVLGQLITKWSETSLGLSKTMSASVCCLVLIALSVILTGLGIYKKLVKWGGAGALVPITGFANSITAPAVEFQVEGQVYGIGCSIFKIAGPVILYGIFTSWVLGLGYWVLKILNIV